MIFVDETGKRWQKIKRSTRLLGSTITVPVVVLAAAAMFYLPNWGNFSLPQLGAAKNTPANQPENAVLPAQTSRTQSTGSNSQTNSVNDTQAPTNESALNGTDATSTTPTDTTGTVDQPTTTPTQADSGLSNKPIDPSNRDYGQSHQPTRS